ncbi:TetR/AcrR family transcriptional regulator [Bacillus cihuensis]|uniref:TetR/AcrR family transcriptional regulator n=1 Tax=Bacillus cihuensis TaxID=1208599 RepID=UPI0004248A55|nr:TetR/AcrR family transcriptional regulator [Bacillus cihuensis]
MDMENRKEQIIERALVHIKKRGYLSFSYDHLSKELGLTKASIHYHFEKKESLGLAVCDRLETGLDQMMITIKQMDIDPKEKAIEFLRMRLSYIDLDEICPISAFQADFPYLPEILKQSVQHVTNKELGCVAELLKDIHNNEAKAILLLSALKGALQYRRAVGGEIMETISKQLKELLQ